MSKGTSLKPWDPESLFCSIQRNGPSLCYRINRKLWTENGVVQLSSKKSTWWSICHALIRTLWLENKIDKVPSLDLVVDTDNKYINKAFTDCDSSEDVDEQRQTQSHWGEHFRLGEADRKDLSEQLTSGEKKVHVSVIGASERAPQWRHSATNRKSMPAAHRLDGNRDGARS